MHCSRDLPNSRHWAPAVSEIKSYRDLFVWQRSMDLCAAVYALTRQFPPDERFGLTSQLRRGSVAIPNHIAEGYGRMNTGDYRRFLTMAFGSLMQVETQLLLAERFELAEIKAALAQWTSWAEC